jgi:hypothetical protein
MMVETQQFRPRCRVRRSVQGQKAALSRGEPLRDHEQGDLYGFGTGTGSKILGVSRSSSSLTACPARRRWRSAWSRTSRHFHVVRRTWIVGGSLFPRASHDVNAGFALQTNHLRGTMQMKALPTAIVGSAASALMLSGFAFAQQQSQPQQQYQQGPTQQLTVREVRQFMGGIERDINQMVQTGNLSRLRQWTQNNIADNAVFNRTNSIETEGQSRAVTSITITKPDLLRLQRFALSGMSERLNSVEDFRLDIQVLNIQPVGDSAAMVKSRVSERATLAPRQRESGGRVGEQHESTTGQGRDARPDEEFEDEQSRRQSARGQRAALQLEAEGTCTHLIERNRDAGRIQIAMGICNVETNAQL